MSTKISRKKFTELLRTIIKKEIKEASTTATAGGEYSTPNAFQSKGNEKRKKTAEKGTEFKVVEGKWAVTVDGVGKVIVDAQGAGQAKTIVGRQLKKGLKGITKVSRVQTAFGKQLDKKTEIKEANLRDLANAGKVDKVADEILKQMKVVKALHLKGKNKQAKVVLNNKVYADLEYLSRAFRQIGESITEARYTKYRNDDTLTAKQKIGVSMREVRDKLTELSKLIDMNVKLKNELSVDSKSYWKNTHKAMNKISERLVKLANKVGKLQ